MPTGNNHSRRLVWDKNHTRELFRRYRIEGDEAARDELVTMYLNLVRYLASRFRNRGEALDDLIQVGTIGLIKAIDRFEPERELEFTTYATPTIVGEIKRHFRDKGWAIKVPRRLQELSYDVTRAVDLLTSELQRSPTIHEIAKRLGVSNEDVLEAMESSGAYAPASIDGDQDSGDEGFSILDHIGRDDPLLEAVDDRITLENAMAKLSRQEQTVLYLRFYKGSTQTEIAEEMGISQMQVSRLLRRTLKMLRESIVEEGR